MANDWQEYQDEAASFFRSLGLKAETDAKIDGVRTRHYVDVLVRLQHVGFEITWIVECKFWKSSVSKLHVLGLRQIVIDVGADRGIILSEAGFQSGAVEAAALTNVHVTSLAKLKGTASSEVFSMRLRELFDRVEMCKEKYWSISKPDRIEHGLRGDVGEVSYSGREVIDLAEDLLRKALRGAYPIEPDFLLNHKYHLPQQFSSAEALVHSLEPFVGELEAKLERYFQSTQSDTTGTERG